MRKKCLMFCLKILARTWLTITRIAVPTFFMLFLISITDKIGFVSAFLLGALVWAIALTATEHKFGPLKWIDEEYLDGKIDELIDKRGK